MIFTNVLFVKPQVEYDQMTTERLQSWQYNTKENMTNPGQYVRKLTQYIFLLNLLKGNFIQFFTTYCLNMTKKVII